MSREQEDWGEYAKKAEACPAEIGDNAKAVLVDQVTNLFEAETKLAHLEDEVKKTKELIRNISEDQIPSTLEDMGLEMAVVDGGLKIEIKETTFATPKAADRERVFNWLEEHGHSGLIKRKVIFNVGRDKEEEARELIESVEQFPGSFERKVEPQTLKKFVSEQLEAGTDIPMEMFGARVVRAAKVTDNRGNGASN